MPWIPGTPTLRIAILRNSTPRSGGASRGGRGALLAVLLFFVASAATGQGAAAEVVPGEPFVDSVDVDIVNIEVYVTDTSGRPVTGLERGDFVLKQGGQVLEVANFYAVEGGKRLPERSLQPAAMGAPPVAVAKPDPLFLLVYVDHRHLSVFSRKRALAFLELFLEKRLKDGDRVMVMSDNGSLITHQGFTTERKLLARALTEVDAIAGLGANREEEYQRVISDMLFLNEAAQSQRASEPCSSDMQRPAEQYAQALYDEVEHTVAQLESFVTSLASLPGRKAILHVSDGIPLMPGAEAFEFLFQVCSGFGAADGVNMVQDASAAEGAGELAARQAPLKTLSYDTSKLFENLTDVANASGVVFYPIEAFGPRQHTSGGGGDRREFWQNQGFWAKVNQVRVANLQDPLSLIATETGGQAIFNTIDLEPALARIGDDLDTYYSLGFSAGAGSGKEQQIDIDVNRPGLRARHRKSFRSKPLSEKLADRTLGTLEFGLVDNPLGTRLQIGKPLPLDKELRMVPIRILVPFANLVLLPEGDSRRGKLSVYVAARDRRGWRAPVRTAEVPIEMPEARFQEVREKGFAYEVKMLMRPGEHSVAIGVRDEIGATASFLLEDVVIER